MTWTISAGVTLVFLAPLIWLVAGSFRASSAVFDVSAGTWFDADVWTLSNYVTAARRAGLGHALLTSLLQVVVIAAAGLLVNSMAAFALARLVFRGRELLFAGIVALTVLPIEALAIPLLLTVRSLGLTGGYAAAFGGLTLPFVAKAFNIYFLRQHFLSVPKELEEAAALDGADAWAQFWSISLPAVRPALLTVTLIDVLTHWGDFLWPLLLATRDETRTIQVGLASLFTRPPVDWGAILAYAVLATLPVVGLFLGVTKSRMGVAG